MVKPAYTLLLRGAHRAALNGHALAVRGSRIAVIGVAYKAGGGDLRQSPAMKIIDELSRLGADVVYHDDYVAELAEHALVSRSLDDVLDDCQLAVIVTAHPGIDLQVIVDRAPLVVGLRGGTRGMAGEHLVRL